jgi:hypothetical protein
VTGNESGHEHEGGHDGADDHDQSPSSRETAMATTRMSSQTGSIAVNNASVERSDKQQHHHQQQQQHQQGQHAGISPESSREQIARSGLARFFRQGIDAGIWGVFDGVDCFRIAYVGTAVSNLAQLVDLHRLFRGARRPMSSTAAGAGAGSGDTGATAAGLFDTIGTGSEAGTILGTGTGTGAATGSRGLHYPYPPIRPPKPWKPEPDAWGPSCSAVDLAADVSSFPAPEVRDALVAAYFKHIHPALPIISKPGFMAAYRSPDRPPPLLLFQAVLMAGAHACEHPLVASDRHAVKSILFRRASMLYHTRHETDRMHLLQAAAIFTWHLGDGDTVTGGPWYWAGLAVRIGCGLGAHRQSSTLPALEVHQYRRCWWSAFVCEVFSSLETGRPCAVRAEDIDQTMLTDDDMSDTPGQGLTPSSAGAGIAAPAPDALRPDFLNHMVELAYIGLDVLAASAPSQERLIDVNNINTRLGLWSFRAGLSSSGSGSSSGPADDAALCLLRLHYNLMLLHLHRHLASAPISEPASQAVCASAARGVIAALESLAALGGVASCHFTGVSASTAAGIQLADEIRAAAASREVLVVIHALEQLGRLLRCVSLLARHWPNAEAVHSVFQELHQEYEGYVTQDLQGEHVIVPEAQPEWNRLLSGVTAAHLNSLAADQDWLNIPDWSGLI